MSDQVSTPPPPPSGQAPTTTQNQPAANPPADDVGALKARLALLEKETSDARAEAAKYRKRNDEETAQKLKEQGDYKALYEKHAPDLEKAKRYDAFVERETKRLEAEADTLAPHEKLALSKVSALEDKIELLNAFKGARSSSTTQTQPPPKDPPPSGGPPGPAPPQVDLQKLGAMTERELADFATKHPDVFERAIDAGIKKPPRPSTWRDPAPRK